MRGDKAGAALALSGGDTHSEVLVLWQPRHDVRNPLALDPGSGGGRGTGLSLARVAPMRRLWVKAAFPLKQLWRGEGTSRAAKNGPRTHRWSISVGQRVLSVSPFGRVLGRSAAFLSAATATSMSRAFLLLASPAGRLSQSSDAAF